MVGFNFRFEWFAVFAYTDLYAHHVSQWQCCHPFRNFFMRVWQILDRANILRDGGDWHLHLLTAMSLSLIVHETAHNWVVSLKLIGPIVYQINKSIPSTLAILKINHQISPSKMFFSFIILWISSQSQEICSLFLVSPFLLVFCPICAIHITTPLGQIRLYNLVQYICGFQKSFLSFW